MTLKEYSEYLVSTNEQAKMLNPEQMKAVYKHYREEEKEKEYKIWGVCTRCSDNAIVVSYGKEKYKTGYKTVRTRGDTMFIKTGRSNYPVRHLTEEEVGMVKEYLNSAI